MPSKKSIMEYLEQHWQEIATEATRIQKIVPISDEIRTSDDSDYDLNSNVTKHWIRGWTGDPGWLNFGIIYIGQWIPYAQQECPKTTIALKELAKEYPIAMAGLSWLKPKTGIPPHTDNTPGKITYHLGLNVPEQCMLIANGKLLRHENGKIIHFDSNLPHSALNGSEYDRIILYLLLKSY